MKKKNDSHIAIKSGLKLVTETESECFPIDVKFHLPYFYF